MTVVSPLVLGTIAQAMHIRPMAGPHTKLIDLKGRSVVLELILTHEHPYDWNPVSPAIVKKVLTDDTCFQTGERSGYATVRASAIL